jgi:hypothetical protein
MRSFSIWKKHWLMPSPVIVFIGLAAIVVFFYQPILSGFFISDDYSFLSWLLDHASFLLRGEHIGEWFFASGAVFLRPVVQWLFLWNYWSWDTNATGYYAVNLLLHTLNGFLVYLLVFQITRQRLGAFAAALLFVLHPLHAESVAWIADCVDLLAAFFCLLSAVYFVLFRQKSKQLYYAICLISFALAALTKESALTLPAIFLTYDLFNLRQLSLWQGLKAQLPIWLLLPGYVALRFLLFGKFGGYADQGFLKFGWELFVQYYALVFAKPFLADIDFLSLAILLALVALLVVFFRQSKALWLGLAWIVALLIPAGSANYVAPRLAYIPSVGLAIAQGAIVTSLLAKRATIWRGLAIGLLALITIAYSWSLAARVDDWAAVGRATRAVIEKTRALYPALPPGARLYYVGVPQYLRGIDVYAGTFPFAFKIAYRDNPTLWVKSVDKFPIVSERLEETFFFEYRHRQVIEHPAARQILLARRLCEEMTLPSVEWIFSQDAQGWEPWSQLASFGMREGALEMRAQGEDPYMGSPPMDAPALSLGQIEITMRVRADSVVQQGRVYWLLAGASDFSPDLNGAFPVQADGEFHTYRVDLAATGLLSIEDRITQLRVDPVETPAEIAIKMIRMTSRCASLDGNLCQCK